VLEVEQALSGHENPSATEADDLPVVTHKEHQRINSRPVQRPVQQIFTYHCGIHQRLQGWQEGHAPRTEWDPILVIVKVIAEIAEDAGNHVPKMSAYQVRKGVIDFILGRLSIDEIEQGQTGEALQQVVREASHLYSGRMKSAFPKEVEHDIATKFIA
jgi:hypothetical protein